MVVLLCGSKTVYVRAERLALAQREDGIALRRRAEKDIKSSQGAEVRPIRPLA